MRKKRYIRPNPPAGAVKIYDDALEFRAIKGNNSHFPNEPFVHEFKGKSKVEIYGLPDGSLLVIGSKPLWKWFEY